MGFQKATIRAEMVVHQTGNSDAAPSLLKTFGETIALVAGTGAGQADVLFYDERTVASGANDDLDLRGVLTDAFGATVDVAEIVAILLINKPSAAGAAANTTNLTVGGGSNPVTGLMGGTTPVLGPFRPGAVWLEACPDAAGLSAVVAGTGDILRITNAAGAPNTYQILIIGRSA